MATLITNLLRPRTIALGACLLGTLAFIGCDSGPDYANGPDGSAVNDTGCMRRNNFLERLLTECVTIAGVNEHLEAFQGFADANDGHRRDGSAGFDASADYIAATLEAAGYAVTRTPVNWVRIDAELARVAPGTAQYATFHLTFSGFGSVIGPVTAVDLQLGVGNTSTSGCEPADFAGFPAGNVALIQRGTCPFADKATNALAAGASAVIIMNQGNTLGADRQNVFQGTLGAPVNLPVVAASYADGVEMAGLAGLIMRVRVTPVDIASENIIAELAGASGQVVMAGANFESWPDGPINTDDGPGINTNGSGASVLLEVAQNLANTRLDHTVRFAWWGAHAAGLVGAIEYVDDLTEPELEAIALYLNFDAIGSPNYARFVIDSDGSDGGGGFPASAPVEQAFYDFYTSRGLAAETIPIQLVNSEWAPFAAAGIPFGAIHTGSQGAKTAAQAATYGGTAGVAYDPCYQQACDTIDNVNLDVLDVNADAAAAVILHFGMADELPIHGGSTSNAHAAPVLAAAE